ncbi:MAG: PspC domain-containing protein [Chloroflexi bacterium]|nr:PspC domain-containing protein [Chloroflexota bacterium]
MANSSSMVSRSNGDSPPPGPVQSALLGRARIVSSPGGSGFRLFRSEDDRKISGVAGGLAEGLGIDPTLVRLLWVLVVLVTSGVGLLAYLAMWAIVPQRSEVLVGTAEPSRPDPAPKAADSTPDASAGSEPAAARPAAARRPSNGPVIAGVALIVVGALFLLDNWVSLQFWSYVGDLINLALRFWPVLLIVAGAMLVFSRLRR